MESRTDIMPYAPRLGHMPPETWNRRRRSKFCNYSKKRVITEFARL
jgi:hypothetical protein